MRRTPNWQHNLKDFFWPQPRPIWRRRDKLLTALIAIICLVAVVGAWFNAPVRQAHLERASAEFTAVPALDVLPENLQTLWEIPDTARPGDLSAVTVSGLTITSPDGSTITAHTPSGEVLWSYSRPDKLCTLATAWKSVVATYRTGVGCGDVVTFKATTGEYAGTRSAINSNEVMPLQSNDRIGTISTNRAELWRSDMVRTVEYGYVEAPQEPDMQPHADCELTSGLTRKSLLALTMQCPDNPNENILALLDTTPKDAREPKTHKEINVPKGSKLVAISESGAAIYIPQPVPTLRSYDKSGAELSTAEFPISQALEFSALVPDTADLPHHMSWFTGSELVLFEPKKLALTQVFPNAIGTPVAIAGQLIFPTAAGIAIANWDTGEIIKEIPVERQGYLGPVGLAVAGPNLLEKRGNTVVALGR
ncbi:hypothetical protein [Corynebacterium caspium]|uniref:Rv3212 family protein n=1 Tax=Corynebacterium caspium TaxID=234828 RepID=UPI0003676C92|nr:hypothetical protein [Corynebacterium caspium]WKD59696.1 hypothetical protein CCASP_06585 [Corynebacterium caspium DSM 44850]